MTLKEGDFITIDYIGRLKESGQIFDLTKEEVAKKEGLNTEHAKFGAVPVVVGANHVVPGLDKKLIEFNENDKKTVTLEPQDAFGERDQKKIQLVPMSVFKKERLNPMPGMPVNIGNQRGTVVTASGGRVKVDFNNPLAGKVLEYEIEIHKKITDKKAQVQALFDLHLPQVELDGLKIQISGETAEIETPQVEKTRRFINLTEEILSRDIRKYVDGIKVVKFIDIFQ